jgi:hypothetical protein
MAEDDFYGCENLDPSDIDHFRGYSALDQGLQDVGGLSLFPSYVRISKTKSSNAHSKRLRANVQVFVP